MPIPDPVKKSNPEKHMKIINFCVMGLVQVFGPHNKI